MQKSRNRFLGRELVGPVSRQRIVNIDEGRNAIDVIGPGEVDGWTVTKGGEGSSPNASLALAFQASGTDITCVLLPTRPLALPGLPVKCNYSRRMNCHLSVGLAHA